MKDNVRQLDQERDEAIPAPISIVELMDDHIQIKELLSQLDERQRQVLQWSFGVLGHELLEQSEIGRRLGISERHVRRLKEDALALLRTM
jgi:RNA polymerase sigma factor (sigma-70 family)